MMVCSRLENAFYTLMLATAGRKSNRCLAYHLGHGAMLLNAARLSKLQLHNLQKLLVSCNKTLGRSETEPT